MNLEFGNIPQQESKNTIILAAGTICCSDDNFSYLRKVNHICEARERESVMIINFDQMLTLISGEIKGNNIIVNEEQKIKINLDTNKVDSNADKVIHLIKPEDIPEKNTINFNDIFYERKNSICLLNINNDGIESIFFKRKTFNPNKLKDKFKEGLNVIIQHEPSTKTMSTEYFIVNTTYCIGKDAYRVHSNLLLGLCEDMHHKNNELIFEILSGQLKRIGRPFLGYFLESRFYCEKGGFINEKQAGTKYIQNQEQTHKKAFLIKRDKFYAKPTALIFEFQNLDIKPNGSIVYKDRKSIPTISYLKEQAASNGIKFSEMEKLKDFSDDNYITINVDTMKEIATNEIIDSKILGDFIILKINNDIINAKIIETDELGFREIFDTNIKVYDNKDRRNVLDNDFIKLPKTTLGHLVKDILKDKDL